MAELYANPSFFNNSGDKPIGNYTGNPEIDRELDLMPEEERQAALAEITAPATGEEVANTVQRKLAEGEIPNISIEDYRLYKSFIKTKETDILDAIGQGADMVFQDLMRAAGSVADKPVESLSKLTPTTIEAFGQGTRNLYGMLAQSQDPNSTFFRIKNAITADGSDEEAEFRQFKDALEFNARSNRIMAGKETVLMDKDLINPELAQAMSYVADPTLFIPFGGVAAKGASMIGMAEGLAKASARASAIKQMVIGNAVKWGVGAPIEFLGGATRATIDGALERGSQLFEKATGISAKEAQATARMSGLGSVAAEAMGQSINYLPEITEAYVGATAARGFGEAIGAVGDQMLKGNRGVRSYARMALKEAERGGIQLSDHAKGLLKVIDTFDPMFSYAADATNGMAQGMAIGGTLGFLGGGEEGMASGMGAGVALGGVGALGGRIFADLSGATRIERTRITTDMIMNGLRDLDPVKYKDFETLRAVARAKGVNIDGYIAGFDTIAPELGTYFKSESEHAANIKSRGFDPATYDGSFVDENGRRLFSMEQFKRAEGFVIDKGKDGKVLLGVNLDNLKKNTVPHEAFHAIFRTTLMQPEFQRRMTENILGVFDKDGKMVSPPKVSQDEALGFFLRYLKALHKGDEYTDNYNRLKTALAEYYKDGQTTVMDRDGKTPYLAAMAEEFGAYYFTQFIEGKPIDYLYLGGKFEGMRGLIESAKEGWLDYWESRTQAAEPRFDITNPDGIDYAFKPKGGKRVRVSALDYMMRDLIRSAEQTNREGRINLNSLSPETRERLVKGQGLDGVVPEKRGVFSGRTTSSGADPVKAYNKKFGPEVYKAILALPDSVKPKMDGEGNFVGPLSKEVLEHIVNTGLVSREMANKISMLQDMASGKLQTNIAEMGYVGWSKQVGTGPNPPRVYGDAVPYKRRKVLVLGVDTQIGKNGMSFTARTLDMKVIESRANNLWANSVNRALWKDNRTAFVQDFFRYLENASKTDAEGRVPSAQLWTEEGAAKRDVMHQMAGIPRREGDTFVHAPIAEIHQDIYNSVMNLTVNRMTDIRTSGDRVTFNPTNADPFIRVNMKVEEMPQEKTPEGRVYRDSRSGFKFHERNGVFSAYDKNGELIGNYSNIKEAERLALRVYERQQAAMKRIGDELSDGTKRGVTWESRQEFINRSLEKIKSNPVLFRENLMKSLKDVFGGSLTDENISILKEMSDAVAQIEADRIDGREKSRPLRAKLTDIQIKLKKLTQDESGNFYPDDKIVEIKLTKEWDSLVREGKSIARDVANIEGDSLSRNDKIKDLTLEAYRKLDASGVEFPSGWSFTNLIEALGEITNDDAFSTTASVKRSLSPPTYRILPEGYSNEINFTGVLLKDVFSAAEKRWSDQFPNTFRSRLLEKVQALHKQNPNITYNALIKKILRDSSQTYNFWAESEAIGLVDFLRSKIDVTTKVQKIRDAQGNWTGGIKDGKKGITQEVIDIMEVENYIKDKAITLTPEVGAREVTGYNTYGATIDGAKSAYNETALRISGNEGKYQHGVRGHYGEAVVHHRSTLRPDINGETIRFIEEIQANNALEKKDSAIFSDKKLKEMQTSIELGKEFRDTLLRKGTIVKKDGRLQWSVRFFNNEELPVLKQTALISDGFLERYSSAYDGRSTKNVPYSLIKDWVKMQLDAGFIDLLDRIGSQLDREGGNAETITSRKALELVKNKDTKSLEVLFNTDNDKNIKTLLSLPETLNIVERFVQERVKTVEGIEAVRHIIDNPSVRWDLSEVYQPHFIDSRISDFETKIRQHELAKSRGIKLPPFTQISEWGAVAIKDIIRQAVMNGEDKLALTHGDDTPALCGMEPDARTADYGRIFPDVIRKIVEPYGIEVRVRNEIQNNALKNPELIKATDEKIKAQQAVMEEFKKTQGAGEDPSVISELSLLLAKPAYEVGKDIGEWARNAEHLRRQVRSESMSDKIMKAIDMARDEATKYKDSIEAIEGNLDPSALAIDRATSFTLNKEIKEAVRSGELFTQFKPEDEQGGRIDSPIFNSFKDVIYYREQRWNKEVESFMSHGLSREDAQKLLVSLDSRSNSSSEPYLRKVSKENRIALERLIENQENPYDWDRQFNPSELEGLDKNELAREIVQNIGKDEGTKQVIGDKFLHLVSSLHLFKENGGNLSDIAKELDSYTTRNSNSQGDKTYLFKKISDRIKLLLQEQGINLEKGEFGKKELGSSFNPEDISPSERFKVDDEVKKNLRSLQSAIDKQSDKDKVPAEIRAGVGRLIQAIERQHKADIKEIPQAVKEGFRALADAVDNQADLDKVPAGVKRGLRLLMESAQYEDLKPQAQMPKPTATKEQLASGLEALGKAVGVKGRVKRPKAPTPPAEPPVTPPKAPATPAPEPSPEQPAGPQRALEPTYPSVWQSFTYEKTPQGGLIRNAIGYMILIQGDKFKVYNPQKAVIGIYQDEESAKRRVLRDMPKR